MEVVVEIMEKLLRENVMIIMCKTPKEAPRRKEYQETTDNMEITNYYLA